MAHEKFLADFKIQRTTEAAFKARVEVAGDDVLTLADLLAEASRHERSTRGDSVVGKDGRARFTASQLFACYMVDAAEQAYSAARAGVNRRAA